MSSRSTLSDNADALDLSDNDRGELEIHRSDKHFRRLLDKLPAGAYLCDADGLITYYNQEAVEVWGRAPQLNDTIDRFCGSFKLYRIDGTPMQHDECWMALALKHNREYNGQEIMIERPDGSRLIALAHANPIHDDAGRVVGAVNVLVDITERKRAEDSLRQSDRAKDEFLAMLSHELRNPLAPIRNALGILRHKKSDEPEGLRALEVIDRQMQHMTRLIGDLLDISRINDGRLVLQESEVALNDVLDAAIETSRPLMDGSGHEFVVTRLPQPAFVMGDENRLAQAIANVLNNAATYTPPGGRIELALEREGDAVLITIRDDGIGIRPDKLEGIFDMFSQADRHSECRHEGLGIGLALARHVLELQGGSISAHSEGLGLGSTFRLRMPIHAFVGAPPTGDAATDHHMEAAAAKSNHRVLVVDDNPDVIESMELLLEILDVDVRTARSGSEALDIGETYRPDVILMDIGMPGMNGLECASAIRQKDWGKAARMIAVTGWGQESDVQRSLDAGFDNHLVKPMDPDELMAFFL